VPAAVSGEKVPYSDVAQATVGFVVGLGLGLGLDDPDGFVVGLGVTVGVGDGVGVTVGVAVDVRVGLCVGETVGLESVGEGAGALLFAMTRTITTATTAIPAMIAVTIHATRALREPRSVE